MSQWGVFTLAADEDVHVAPCSPEGEVIGEHTLDVQCWCNPNRDDLAANLIVHNDRRYGGIDG